LGDGLIWGFIGGLVGKRLVGKRLVGESLVGERLAGDRLFRDQIFGERAVIFDITGSCRCTGKWMERRAKTGVKDSDDRSRSFFHRQRV
jgi:hypothetical protein